MEVHSIEVEIYKTKAGAAPYLEWLSLQDPSTRGRINARVAKLRSGNLGKFEKVGDNIMELKENFGPGYRIYCRQVGKQIVLLLCGGDKSSQKRDIKRAKEFWKDYQVD